MIKVIVGRLLQLIPVLGIILTLTFFMSKVVPGGPFSAERQATPEVIAKLNAYYGLDRPLWEQYLTYLGNVVRFNFGPSYTYQSESVNEVIARAFPISLQIGTLAFCIALIIGVTAGVVAAANKNKLWDYFPMSLSMLGICLPTFVLGPILALVFGLVLKLAPVSGWYGLNYVPFHPMIMPAVTLGLFYAAYIARLTRGGMLDILSQDFIRTARAKGVPDHEILLKHALRGGLLPVVAFLGPAFAGLISGSFVVEKVFNVPGLGQEFIKSVFNRDYPLILGTVAFFGTLIVLFNLVSDIVQALLDPKSRK
ncbi:MAG: ABC transporter permease subunit [Verrucomicrobia bacterium]|jgi:oligopeptide transport system permease protein|nr:ABC transporter permease subunit [Verrucomicrobiota bacterium]